MPSKSERRAPQLKSKSRKRIVRPYPPAVELRLFYLGMTKDDRWEFCKRATTTAGYLNQIFGGWTLASLSVARRIEGASDGRIRASVLRPDAFAEVGINGNCSANGNCRPAHALLLQPNSIKNWRKL